VLERVSSAARSKDTDHLANGVGRVWHEAQDSNGDDDIE
jgi:hypothetical protein